MAKNEYPPAGSRTADAKAQREAHWRRMLEQWKASGLPKSVYARREGISADVLGWWQGEIRKRDLAQRRQGRATVPRRRPSCLTAEPAFVPVRVIDPPPPPNSPAALEVLAGGHVIRIQPGFDPETLKRLVGVLEDRP
jgi:hypothetical protein